jgi:hypothetical protein
VRRHRSAAPTDLACLVLTCLGAHCSSIHPHPLLLHFKKAEREHTAPPHATAPPPQSTATAPPWSDCSRPQLHLALRLSVLAFAPSLDLR